MKDPLKFFLCTIVFVFLHHAVKSQPGWLWANSSTGGNIEEGTSVCTDRNGNIYETGEFADTTITFGSMTLHNNGFTMLFLVKFDPNGNPIWARAATMVSGGSCEGFSVCTDFAGNVIITGDFTGPTITFGSITLTLAGAVDMFIAKYDANGNVLWAKNASCTNADYGYSVATDTSGNIYATGFFNLAPITFDTFHLVNHGSTDIFFVKYAPNGTVVWAKCIGGTGADTGESIKIDQNGKVVITGYFNSPSTVFDTITLHGNAGGYDFFIAKFNLDGNVAWAKSAGGTGDDVGYSACTDLHGNVFATGYYQSPSLTFGSTTVTNSAGSAAFIVKYDSTGNVSWVKSAGGVSGDVGYSVATDSIGNLFVSGGFVGSSITFGSTTISAPPDGFDPMYILKCDTVGNVICSEALASGGDDVNSISVDRWDNAYLGGDFMVNPFHIGDYTLNQTGGENIFIAKYNCDVPDAVNENNSPADCLISPNPSNGIFNLNFTDDNFSKSEITVFNSLGQVVHSAPCTVHSAQSTTLDLTNQPDGIYFVKVESDGKFYSKKIIKQ